MADVAALIHRAKRKPLVASFLCLRFKSGSSLSGRAQHLQQWPSENHYYGDEIYEACSRYARPVVIIRYTGVHCTYAKNSYIHETKKRLLLRVQTMCQW